MHVWRIEDFDLFVEQFFLFVRESFPLIEHENLRSRMPFFLEFLFPRFEQRPALHHLAFVAFAEDLKNRIGTMFDMSQNRVGRIVLIREPEEIVEPIERSVTRFSFSFLNHIEMVADEYGGAKTLGPWPLKRLSIRILPHPAGFEF
jgi:hypothetical protein